MIVCFDANYVQNILDLSGSGHPEGKRYIKPVIFWLGNDLLLAEEVLFSSVVCISVWAQVLHSVGVKTQISFATHLQPIAQKQLYL